MVLPCPGPCRISVNVIKNERSTHTKYTANPQKDIKLPITHRLNVIPTDPTPAKIADGTVYAPTPTVLPKMILIADMTPNFPSSLLTASYLIPGDCGGGCKNHV